MTVQAIGPDGIAAAHTTTAPDGTYAVAGLPNGGYTICFDPNGGDAGAAGLGFLPECWPTAVTVTAGTPTTSIDAVLDVAGSISGHVSAAADAPVAGVVVHVNEVGGEPVTYTLTDDSGVWVVTGLETGTYTVCFDPSGVAGGYEPQCYDAVPATASRTPVTVTATTATTGIDATLQIAPGLASNQGRMQASTLVPGEVISSNDLANVECAEVFSSPPVVRARAGPAAPRTTPTTRATASVRPCTRPTRSSPIICRPARAFTAPVSVVYPADPVSEITEKGHYTQYFDHLWQGVAEARQALTERATQCPNERIVLAGYSQGAMVMHRVLRNVTTEDVSEFLTFGILQRIDAAILVADGDRYPYDTTTNFGSALDNAHGGGRFDATITLAKLPSTFGAKTMSICNADDIICDMRVPAECVPNDVHDNPYRCVQDYIERGTRIHTQLRGRRGGRMQPHRRPRPWCSGFPSASASSTRRSDRVARQS